MAAIFSRYPLDQVIITGGFGQTEGYGYPHKGIDLACNFAQVKNPVRQGLECVVHAIHLVDQFNRPTDGWGDGSFGNTLVLDVKGTPWYVLFAHLEIVHVKVGQKVNPSQVLAISGNSGSKTTGPHLHWQVGDNDGFPPNLTNNVDPAGLIEAETPDPLSLSLAEQLMLAMFSSYEDREANVVVPLQKRLDNARYRLKPLVLAAINNQSLYSRLLSLESWSKNHSHGGPE